MKVCWGLGESRWSSDWVWGGWWHFLGSGWLNLFCLFNNIISLSHASIRNGLWIWNVFWEWLHVLNTGAWRVFQHVIVRTVSCHCVGRICGRLSCNHWSFCVCDNQGIWIERSAEFVLRLLFEKNKISGFDVTGCCLISCVFVFLHHPFCFSILMLELSCQSAALGILCDVLDLQGQGFWFLGLCQTWI